MSTYDTFVDPTTGWRAQSKAFGKGMRIYQLGERVRPRRSPVTELEYAAAGAGHWDDAVAARHATLQVLVAPTGGRTRYIEIVDGVYTGITGERDRSVPLVDHFGRDVDG